jgi:hypothetical protein
MLEDDNPCSTVILVTESDPEYCIMLKTLRRVALSLITFIEYS